MSFLLWAYALRVSSLALKILKRALIYFARLLYLCK